MARKRKLTPAAILAAKRAVIAKLKAGINLSIAEFCVWSDLSRATYFDYRKHGLGPEVVQVRPDARVQITPEAAMEWAARHQQPKTLKSPTSASCKRCATSWPRT